MEDSDTVGELAELYLGNILYAIERAAISLEAEGKSDDADFYRGIGRALAEARGRAIRRASPAPSPPPPPPPPPTGA